MELPLITTAVCPKADKPLPYQNGPSNMFGGRSFICDQSADEFRLKSQIWKVFTIGFFKAFQQLVSPRLLFSENYNGYTLVEILMETSLVRPFICGLTRPVVPSLWLFLRLQSADQVVYPPMPPMEKLPGITVRRWRIATDVWVELEFERCWCGRWWRRHSGLCTGDGD
ncbi:hypothetical protein OUZ56_005541 [Daphnia magna]|uniref:Uncharacterized protein n=1 Tax=Daphnia magna TaxID=35525 RepID=A0ABQ9YT63_9CRUS|nr:hypothetical protein OUZ56_005541 [Daphnia magna]